MKSDRSPGSGSFRRLWALVSWFWFSCFCSLVAQDGGITDASVNSDRTVREGDSIAVIVLGEGSISGSFKVGNDGKVNYPLLGRVHVSGRSIDQVAADIENLLEKDLIRDAVVSVTMSDRQVDSVFVFGAVRSQGSITFDPEEGITLGRAVARVGGTSEMANIASVKIQRAKDSDLNSIIANLNNQQELPLEDGDIVIVPSKPEIVAESVRASVAVAEEIQTGRVVVSGEVNREGIIEVPLQGGIDILEAIALSGGFTRLARPSKVKVRREVSEGVHETVTVNVDEMRKAESGSGFRVYAGDTIFVPESFF